MTNFASRHIGPSPDEQARMLETVGYDSVEALMDRGDPRLDPVAPAPGAARPPRPRPRSWPSCARSPGATGTLVSMIGLGYYGTVHARR